MAKGEVRGDIITKYPEYAGGYILRIGALCQGQDRGAILSTIDRALKYLGNSPTEEDTVAGLLSMRAKIEHLNGEDGAALNDLDKAIHAHLDDPTKFVNSGAVAPEMSASLCDWSLPEFDALVARFPRDYRAYISLVPEAPVSTRRRSWDHPQKRVV
jgi:hypothetical protein